MAGNAGERRVFRRSPFEHIVNIFVARRAVPVGHVGAVSDHERLMRGVACRAVLIGHFRRVRLVALQAFGDVPVSLVAGCAKQFRMAAWKVFHLFALLWMAGQAWGGEVMREFYLERRVRVGMTGFTASDFIMRLPGMAGAAERNNLFLAYHGGMPLMAARAGDGGFVLCALAVDHRLNTCVTFDAVGIEKGCRRFGCLFLRVEREEKSGECEQEKRQQQLQAFSV